MQTSTAQILAMLVLRLCIGARKTRHRGMHISLVYLRFLLPVSVLVWMPFQSCFLVAVKTIKSTQERTARKGQKLFPTGNLPFCLRCWPCVSTCSSWVPLSAACGKAGETLARNPRYKVCVGSPHARKLNKNLKKMFAVSVRLLCICPQAKSKQAGTHGMLLTLSEFRWMMHFLEFQAPHNDNAAFSFLYPKCEPYVLACSKQLRPSTKPKQRGGPLSRRPFSMISSACIDQSTRGRVGQGLGRWAPQGLGFFS